MKYKSIIIDGNNLFFRSIYLSLKKETIEDVEIQTGAIKHALGKIKDLINTYGYSDITTVYILFDNTESKINLRKVITQGHYKHSREKDKLPANFYHSLNVFEEVLKNYSDNYRISFAENLEADDLVKPILEYIKPEAGNEAMVVSVDLDWARNISNHVHWFNWKEIYDYDIFFIKHSFVPLGNRIKIFKALHGDNADNIENAVPYLPRKILLHIVNNYNSLEALFENLNRDDEISGDWKTKIKKAKSKLLVNYQLVDFIEIDKPIEKIIIKCEENIKGLRLWYKVLNFEFEDRMELKEEKGNSFFSKRRYKK